MSNKNKIWKTLRVVVIGLFGLTVLFQLMGGLGSSCVAFGAEKYKSMAGIVPYKWLYQVLVILTTGVALVGVRALIGLSRHENRFFRIAIGFLIGGSVLAGIQMIASQVLRGASAPNNIRFYLTLITLAVFLLIYLTGAGDRLWGARKGTGDISNPTIGVAIALTSMVVFTAHSWAATSHTIDGINYADLTQTQVTLGGFLLMSVGLMLGGLICAWLEKLTTSKIGLQEKN